MNIKKTIFVVGGIGIILILSAIRFEWFDLFKKQKNISAQKTAVVTGQRAAKVVAKPQTAPKTKPAVISAEKKRVPAPHPAPKTEKKELLGSGDPFAYSPAGNGDYTPLSGNKNVGVITVKGIIHIEGEAPRAILHLLDTDRVHYVSKNSVVRVNSKNKTASSPAEAYIVVKDIRNDEVELIQLERPDKVIIIR